MKRTVLFAIAMSVALLPAGVAFADSNDDDFVRMVNNIGVTGAPADLIANGHIVCQLVASGNAPRAVADAVASSLHFRPDRAAVFSALSVTHYCPQYGNQAF